MALTNQFVSTRTFIVKESGDRMKCRDMNVKQWKMCHAKIRTG